MIRYPKGTAVRFDVDTTLYSATKKVKRRKRYAREQEKERHAERKLRYTAQRIGG